MHDKCEKKIIHCDVKAANIMLDDKFEPVVADFKSAKIMDHNVTHITTSVTGTIGHIAPEHIASGKCSDKSDVFSYGSFLLELVTERRIIDLIHVADEKDMMYVDWVRDLLTFKVYSMNTKNFQFVIPYFHHTSVIR